mmetsp:Transcript_8164/g.13746  ORF Transcript_8164/g.13746 Transcript_8164/m.13746 type:complete len:84 (+) Transcript_8164:116-367(+)
MLGIVQSSIFIAIFHPPVFRVYHESFFFVCLTLPCISSFLYNWHLFFVPPPIFALSLSSTKSRPFNGDEFDKSVAALLPGVVG